MDIFNAPVAVFHDDFPNPQIAPTLQFKGRQWNMLEVRIADDMERSISGCSLYMPERIEARLILGDFDIGNSLQSGPERGIKPIHGQEDIWLARLIPSADCK